MFDELLNQETSSGESAEVLFSGADFFKPQLRLIQGPLALYVRALIAVEVAPLPPIILHIVPHDSVVLAARMGPRAKGFERYDAPGMSVRLTSLRDVRGTAQPAGNCLTLFAVLTPAGAIRLLHGCALSEHERIRTPLAGVLGMASIKHLEDCLSMYVQVQDKLMCMGRWLEQVLLTERYHLPQQAQRAARASSALIHDPFLSLSALAQHERVGPRQLERDFRKWLLVSPKHFAQVVRVQHAARLARRGLSLADVAVEARFADQAHMSRSVKSFTGLSPQQALRAVPNAMARAFRDATGGGLVYV